MSFGNYRARDSRTVQAHNRQELNFEKVKEIYENTKPIQGKRERLNIRPIGERGRTHERVIKVSDNEYYLTCNSWARVDDKNKTIYDYHCRALTFTKSYWGSETVIVHTPRAQGGQLAPSYLNSPSVFWFYHYKLPETLSITNHRGKFYPVV